MFVLWSYELQMRQIVWCLCTIVVELVDVLPKTSQITNGILRLSFFVNNLYDDLRIVEIRTTEVDYVQINAALEKWSYFRPAVSYRVNFVP